MDLNLKSVIIKPKKMKYQNVIIVFKQISVIFILVASISMTGQSPLVSDIIPPSPQAASVFKFTEVPVSLYTGTANITIPLFEIETRGLIVPVSISYHSRGVRVDEIASHVGTGWSLSYGGLVSRQIRGGADEGPYGYMSTDWYDSIFTNSTKRYQSLNDEYPIDRIPDQYYFNINGQSGKFVSDYRSRKFVVQQFGNVKVNSLNEIIDGNGNVFSFSATGRDESGGNYKFKYPIAVTPPTPLEDHYDSSWYLSTIKTPQNGLITYSYINDQTSFMRRSYDKAEYVTQGMNSSWHEYSYGAQINSKQKCIEKIDYEHGYLLFGYGGRDDLSGGKSLVSISQFAKTSFPLSGSPTVKLIKEVKFEYYYTEGDELNVLEHYPFHDPLSSKRMFLKSVQVLTSTDTIPKHKFEYNNEHVLPNRNSNSQDYWGYYNGKNNGRFLKDKYSDLDHNRTVDSNYSKAGILEKIIYPNGGSVKFTYESNVGVAAFPPEVYFPSTNPVLYGDIGMSIMDIYNQPDSIYNAADKVFSRYFKIPKGVLDGSVIQNIPGNCVNYGQNGNGCKYIFHIAKKVPTAFGHTWDLVGILSPGYSVIILAEGEYRLIGKPSVFQHHPLDPMLDAFSATVQWKYQVVQDGLNDFQHADDEEVNYAGTVMTGPGNRIKKIEYDNGLGDIITKTYDYNYGDITSGRIFGLPSFRTLKGIVGLSTMVFGSFPMGGGSPFSTYQGNEIGYGRVTEYIGERNSTLNQPEAIGASTTLGKTEYDFTITTDSGEYYRFPYHPPTDNEWLRGKIRSQKDFKTVGNVFKLIREIRNDYIYAGNTGMDGVAPTVFRPLTIQKPLFDNMDATGYYENDHKFFKLPICTLAPSLDGTTNNITYKVYYLTGGTMDLKSTKTTDYFDNGTEMQSETKYFYNYDKHYNAASVENTGSDGSTNTTKYFYAGEDPVLHTALNAKNMVSMPLLTQNFKGTDLLSQQETTYKNWDNVMLAPEFMKSSKGDKPLETRVEYVKVDPSNGNPLEVKQSGGMGICYIWGYNKTKPIAKIENVTYATVASYVSNLQTLSNGQDEAALIGALNSLRTALPNAMVTTFTYKPLIGVSTITNPSGQQTTYDYDNFGRLKSVKDHNGHLLSENKYHYAAPTN